MLKLGFYKIILLFIVFFSSIFSQTGLLPLEHSFNNRLRSYLLNSGGLIHSSIQPYNLNEFIHIEDIDSVISLGRQIHETKLSWLERKLFNEHLVTYTNDDYKISADFLPDFQLGYDFKNNRNTLLNSRGFLVKGSVTNTFSFYTEFYENQAKFPSYLNSFVKQQAIIPGQGFGRFFSTESFDYGYSSALLNYNPSKYFNIALGHGKNFIGDGYRSFLLSDVAFNYPFVKLTASLNDVKYFIMWSQFEHLNTTPGSDGFMSDKKNGVFHYLDLHLSKNFTVGFFEGIIWLSNDSLYSRNGLEWNFLNPIIFLRPIDFSIGSPGNVVLGINAKMDISNYVSIYSQVMIDEMTVDEYFANNGYWANKYAVQFGSYAVTKFGPGNLFMRGELNTASPFTFSHSNVIKNYGHYNQPLAHPLGANFYEGIGILEYSLGHIESRVQLNYTRIGLDSSIGSSIGQDIYRSYELRPSNYGNYTAQGLDSRIFYANASLSYILNPFTNLRIEGAITYRSIETLKNTTQTLWFTVGLRSSFRNIYYDF